MTIPRRADGIELIGEFEESGFEEPPSLVRRRDGQVIQLTGLLYATLEATDGTRDHAAIAAELTRHSGRTVTPDNVTYLLDKKLRPLGLLKGPDGSEPPTKKLNPLLALRWRVVVSSEKLTNRITAPFAILFKRPIVALVLAGFVAVSCWVLLVHGLAQSARSALYSPGLLLLLFGLTVLSAGFHEFGHAAACRYSGARPGVMGAGVYLVWPAFYTDVTDAYRLGKAGRLRTDLGGLYFNAIFLLAMFGVYAATGDESLLLAVPLQLFQMIHQLMPFVRMDGYYILSDLTGVPDLFSRIKPTLKSAVPGAETDERAAVLKPWVRVVVTAWVLVVVPLLLVSTIVAAITLPRLAATAWDSLGRQVGAMSAAASDGRWTAWIAAMLSIVALALPVLGTVYILSRIARRLAARAWSATRHRPALRIASSAGLVAAAAGLAVLWWPNGEYEPLQHGERGTLIDGVALTPELGSGRPGLTEQREIELQTSTGDQERPDEPQPDEQPVAPSTSVEIAPASTEAARTTDDGPASTAQPGTSSTAARATPTARPTTTTTSTPDEPAPTTTNADQSTSTTELTAPSTSEASP